MPKAMIRARQPRGKEAGFSDRNAPDRPKNERKRPPRRPPISASHCRRWTKPRKGWPSATASGGFGLDEALSIDISRCPRDRKAGRGPRTGFASTAEPAPSKKKRAPLDKKAPIRARP